YGYFNTSELTWGFGDRLYTMEEAVQVRKQLRTGEFDVEAEKEAMRFLGGGNQPTATRSGGASGTQNAASARGPNLGGISFGVYVASCQNGDIRQGPKGLLVYDDNGKREVPINTERETGNGELLEMYRALREGGKIRHDGR